jgi:nicotinate-nucleotide pyrophosphorylase (carboxylating)
MDDPNRLSLPELFTRLTGDGSLARLIAAAREEDLAEVGDVTTASIIEADRRAEAAIVARQAGVIAGMATIPAVFETFEAGGLRLAIAVEDGQSCAAGATLATLAGPLGHILTVERTMLNILGRMCGIATLTRAYVEEIAGTRAVVCETRKTTPGMRSLEKYAVRCGGGTLHRLGLYDAALYKDNHLAHLAADEFAPALARAIKAAKAKHDLKFAQVEVDTLAQLRSVLEIEPGLVDMVLLDNMTVDQLRDAVKMRDAHAPAFLLEASGGVTFDTLRSIAETGVDRVSVGALTHSVTCLDIGLDIH